MAVESGETDAEVRGHVSGKGVKRLETSSGFPDWGGPPAAPAMRMAKTYLITDTGGCWSLGPHVK